MFEYFKLSKKNKELLEEIKILKAQLDILKEYKDCFNYFDNYKRLKGITTSVNNEKEVITIRGKFQLNEDNFRCSPDRYKDIILMNMVKELIPFVELEVVDSFDCGSYKYDKTIVGKINVVKP